MSRIQIIAIVLNCLFLVYTSRLIIRGKLREEYALVWWICGGLLLIFSIWAGGLEAVAHLLGVYEPVNLGFATIIFIILIYLLHLSIANSKLQRHITRLTQEIALMKAGAAEKKDQHNIQNPSTTVENEA
ncbi:DUF2304 domain-containing protein [Niabella hirudinis]|uniref:DUF2304 domain-containing protein n=1 Tax=Niabella hirudinis TaxID=1285929 RepID=UPI003EBD52A5